MDQKVDEEKLYEWLESPEAQKAFKELQRRVGDVIERLRELRKVRWEDLHQPMDI